MPDTRAALFDLYYTLIHHHPRREDIQAEICSQVGPGVTPEAARRAFPAGDEWYHRGNLRIQASTGMEYATKFQAMRTVPAISWGVYICSYPYYRQSLGQK